MQCKPRDMETSEKLSVRGRFVKSLLAAGVVLLACLAYYISVYVYYNVAYSSPLSLLFSRDMLLTFLLIQISSFRYLGVRGKLKHMCDPYIFMFPLNILEDCTLPVSLALRLFGNIFGGMIVVELWMYLMEWLSAFVSSVPFMRAVFVLPLNAFFDMFEPVIQTYIFVTLTMVFLSKGIAGADEDHA